MANLPAKKDVTLALLERSTVFIHLDPRRDGVTVPAWFKNQPQLVLQIGLNMKIPIPDLEVDESGVRCTLSFNRSPFFCNIPWRAVYALLGDDGRGMVWPDDVPEEVVAQAQAEAPKQRGHLRAISTDAEAAQLEASQAARTGTSKANGAAQNGSARGRSKAKTPRAKSADAAAAVPVARKRNKARRAEAQPQADVREPRKPQPVRVEARARIEEAAPVEQRTASDGRSRRRELPPYLRVVK